MIGVMVTWYQNVVRSCRKTGKTFASSEREFILDHQDTCQDISTEFVLAGLPLLSNISGSSGPGANSHWAEKLGNDLAMYHRKSDYLLTNWRPMLSLGRRPSWLGWVYDFGTFVSAKDCNEHSCHISSQYEAPLIPGFWAMMRGATSLQRTWGFVSCSSSFRIGLCCFLSKIIFPNQTLHCLHGWNCIFNSIDQWQLVSFTLE